MRIVVCVKQVFDTTLPLRVEGGVVRQVARRPVVHPGLADCAAVQSALALRAAVGGEVTAVSVGEGEAVRALRFALACGADRAVHVRLAERFDPVGAAEAVAAVRATIESDLVLAGAASDDGSSGLFPAVIAERLGRPLMTGVAAVNIEESASAGPGRRLTVERRLERGDREIARCPLPAVLAADGSAADVPFLSLRAIRRAARAPIEEVSTGSASAPLCELVAIEPPKPRPKRGAGPAASLSAMDRLSHLLSGGVQQKQGGEFVEGTPAAVAAEIVRFLEKRGFIGGRENHG